MKVYGKNTTTPPISDKTRQLRGGGLLVVFLIVAFLLTTLGINAARLQQSVLSATSSNVTATSMPKARQILLEQQNIIV